MKKVRERIRKPIPKMGANLTEARMSIMEGGRPLIQSELAKKLNCSINSISRMENDHGPLTFYCVYKLLQDYQVNPVFLFTGEGEIFL